jgi:hypothetical protein
MISFLLGQFTRGCSFILVAWLPEGAFHSFQKQSLMKFIVFLVGLFLGSFVLAQESNGQPNEHPRGSRSFVRIGGGMAALNLNVNNSNGGRTVWRSTARPLFQVGAHRDFRHWYGAFHLDVLESASTYTSSGVATELFLSGIQMGLSAGWSPITLNGGRGIEFKPRLGGSFYYYALGTAEQSIQLVTTDLLATSGIQSGDWAAGLHLGLSMQDHVSGFGFFFELGYRLGLSNLDIQNLQSSQLGGSYFLVGMHYELFRRLGK